MSNYRVNKNTHTNPNGHNEVHVYTCQHYAGLNEYEFLGSHSNCESAIEEARNRGYNADGCSNCLPLCNND